jgi:hypothetical protein
LNFVNILQTSVYIVGIRERQRFVEDDNEIPLPRYKNKSSWIPKPSKNSTLESFIDLVTIDVQTAASTNIPAHNNLTPAEKGAIQELKERDYNVILLVP